MIRYFKHNQIDKSKWDHCIENSFNKLPYAYTWFLDLVSPNWDALIDEDYLAVMPLTHRRKYGLQYLYQPILCQQLGVFSTKNRGVFTIDSFIESIPTKFKLVEINLNTKNCLSDNLKAVRKIQNVNYILPLNENFETIQRGYIKNHRKNINKFKEQFQEPNIQRVTYLEFYRFKLGFINQWKNKFSESFKQGYLTILKNLEELGKMESYLIYDDDKILLGGICYIFVNEMVTVQTFITEIGRKSGVMYFMIDKFIKENATKDLTIDFMGSMIPGVAYWIKGFGSTETYYDFIRCNRLPGIYNFMASVFNRRASGS